MMRSSGTTRLAAIRRRLSSARCFLVPTSMSRPPSTTSPAPATPSPGGSHSYIRHGNIYLTAPDGSVVRQVTTDGSDADGYTLPSQDDAGTILALRGDVVYHFSRTGQLLQTPYRPPLVLTGGVWDLAISPDGQKAAYETGNMCWRKGL